VVSTWNPDDALEHRIRWAERTAVLDSRTRICEAEARAVALDKVLGARRPSANEPPASVFVRSMRGKLAHELMSAAGCLRAGSLLGAAHHARAIVETRASVHHVVTSQDRAPLFTRFVTFAAMEPWRRYWRAHFDRDAKRISDAEALRRQSLVKLGDIETPDEVVDAWRYLFAKKNRMELAKLNEWHGSTIAKLVRAIGDERASSDYELLCSATHASPLGTRFGTWFGAGGFDYSPDLAAELVKHYVLDHAVPATSELDALEQDASVSDM